MDHKPSPEPQFMSAFAHNGAFLNIIYQGKKFGCELYICILPVPCFPIFNCVCGRELPKHTNWCEECFGCIGDDFDD